MTAIEFISDIEEIIKASWSNFEHDGAATFKLLEKSPVLPALYAKNPHGGRTQAFNVSHMNQIDCHPAQWDEDSSPDSISETKTWLSWNGDLDNPNDSDDDWDTNNESAMELEKGREDAETPQQRNVNAAPNVPGLIRPKRRSTNKAEKLLMTFNIMERRRSNGMKWK